MSFDKKSTEIHKIVFTYFFKSSMKYKGDDCICKILSLVRHGFTSQTHGSTLIPVSLVPSRFVELLILVL